MDDNVKPLSPTAQEPIIKPPDAPWQRHPSAGVGWLPPVEKLTWAEAGIALDRHIRDTHAVLWGRIITVSDQEGRDDAIDWFINIAQAIGLLQPPTSVEPIQVVIEEQVIASVTPIHKVGDSDR